MKGGGRITSQNDCVILIPSILLEMERYMSGNFRGHQQIAAICFRDRKLPFRVACLFRGSSETMVNLRFWRGKL